MAVYTQLKHDKDLHTKLRKRNNDKDKAAYDQLVAIKAGEDAAKAKYEVELKYNVDLEQYKDFATTKQNLLNIKQLWHSTKMLKQPMIHEW